jgi:hypothetical protein
MLRRPSQQETLREICDELVPTVDGRSTLFGESS